MIRVAERQVTVIWFVETFVHRWQNRIAVEMAF